MRKVLVLFAHPRFEASRTNRVLVEAVYSQPGVTFHDLYEHYPEFHIDVESEKTLLSQHDIIIWQHPFYWYSCPPLLKQWIDLVLEFGWAYGPGGNALKGKTCLSVITTGGSMERYRADGSNRYTIQEFMRPFEQTASLCGMNYLSPFAVMGTHHFSDESLAQCAQRYRNLIGLFQTEDGIRRLMQLKPVFLNDLPELSHSAT